MAYKIIMLFLLGVIVACSSNDHPFSREKVQIAISVGHSYKYDLENGIYTVYFMAKPPKHVPFHLSNEEKEKIKRMLIVLDLDTKQEMEHFDDDCSFFPKLIDTLHVTSRTMFKKISIDLNCDDYGSFKAKRVKEFLLDVLRLLNAKPEVQGAPKTDIHYI